jgi:hypothetical protein
VKLHKNLGDVAPGISCCSRGVSQLSYGHIEPGIEFLKTIKDSLPKSPMAEYGQLFYGFSDTIKDYDDNEKNKGGPAIAKFLKENKLGDVTETAPFRNGNYGHAGSTLKAWWFVADQDAIRKYMEDNKKDFA